MDSTKRAILERRAYFVTVAAVAAASGAAVACGPDPNQAVCLAYECTDAELQSTVEVLGDLSNVCVGQTVLFGARAGSRCSESREVTSEAVFAVGDPAIAVCEKNVCRGVAPGGTTITALHDGVASTPTTLLVIACDASATDASATDASASDTATTDGGSSTDGATNDSGATDAAASDAAGDAVAKDGAATDAVATDAASDAAKSG